MGRMIKRKVGHKELHLRYSLDDFELIKNKKLKSEMNWEDYIFFLIMREK